MPIPATYVMLMRYVLFLGWRLNIIMKQKLTVGRGRSRAVIREPVQTGWGPVLLISGKECRALLAFQAAQGVFTTDLLSLTWLG